MILVMGSTGNIGRHLVAELKRHQCDFRALTRNRAKALTLLGKDTPIAEGDYRNEEFLSSALAGIDKLFLLTDQIPDQREVQRRIIDLAKASQVKHIVKISAGKLLTRENSRSSACRAHWKADQYLKNSGLHYTIIHPQAFMDTAIESALPMLRKGKLMTPFSNQRFSFVAAQDIAALAAAALIDDSHFNRCYIASGPEAISWSQLASLIESHTQRKISLKVVPFWLSKLMLKTTVKPKWMGKHKAEMLDELKQPGHAELISSDVLEITGKPPISFDQFLQHNLHRFNLSDANPSHPNR